MADGMSYLHDTSSVGALVCCACIGILHIDAWGQDRQRTSEVVGHKQQSGKCSVSVQSCRSGHGLSCCRCLERKDEFCLVHPGLVTHTLSDTAQVSRLLLSLSHS